jgi:predicted transposase/invertase (TIGR01784 family)
MARKQKTKEQRGQARYLDPHTDFGFKKLFGTEAYKDILQELLPVLLQREDKIEKLSYLNSEKLGRSEIDRKAVYDIYCETEKGEKFIVEMQKSNQDFFKDRSVYYSSFPIQEQAVQGNWNFQLNAVYMIGILNFVFKEDKEAEKQFQYIHHVQLSDTETGKVFYDKLTFIYLELPKFKKEEKELVTMLDKWMYVFKNLALLQERPKALQERVFRRLFRVAEIENLNPEERVAYRQSQKHYWDMNNVINYAFKKAAQAEEKATQAEEKAVQAEAEFARVKEKITQAEEKIIQAEEKIAQAEAEKEAMQIQTVSRLLAKGFSQEEISEVTGMEVHRINEIKEKL